MSVMDCNVLPRPMSSARIAPVPPYRSFFMPWTHSKTKETPSRLRDVRVVFSHYGCVDGVTVSTTLHLHAIDARRHDVAARSISTRLRTGAAAATGRAREGLRRPACRPRPRTGPGARARLRVKTMTLSRQRRRRHGVDDAPPPRHRRDGRRERELRTPTDGRYFGGGSSSSMASASLKSSINDKSMSVGT